MERLSLEIAASGNVPAEVFVKLMGVPARRCNLRGYLRVCDSECTRISIVVEGLEEDVQEYYSYMRLSDQVVGRVTKVEEEGIKSWRETEPFDVRNYEDQESEGEESSEAEESSEGEESSEEEVVGVKEETLTCRRKEVGLASQCEAEEVRVIPETPEKAELSESEPESEPPQAYSPEKEDSQTMLLEAPMSPVFKGGRPQRPREPVGHEATADMFASGEESQSILLGGRAKRRRKLRETR